MVLTVKVPDAFAAEAEGRGLTHERYAENIVAKQPIPHTSTPEKTTDQRMADLEKFFVEMAAVSHNIPDLPDEALNRESFYSDPD
jgi:hypothetical protein